MSEQVTCWMGPWGEGADEYGGNITAERATEILATAGWDLQAMMAAPSNAPFLWFCYNQRRGVVSWGQKWEDSRYGVIRQVRLRDGAHRCSGFGSGGGPWVWSEWNIAN